MTRIEKAAAAIHRAHQGQSGTRNIGGGLL